MTDESQTPPSEASMEREDAPMSAPLGPGPQKGFTLLEVLIAVAILAVSLTSLLGSQLDSMQATKYARQLTAAAFLAEYQLVEIEWQQRQDGWQTNDVTYEGDFDDQGWPEIKYECFVDYIELPEYNQLLQAKEDADRDTDGDAAYTQDAGDNAFGALGMIWPIVKAAIENSIRRASCVVRWKNGNVDEEFDVATFWSDPTALTSIPTMGGEFNTATDDPINGQDGGTGTTGGANGGGGTGGNNNGTGRGPGTQLGN